MVKRNRAEGDSGIAEDAVGFLLAGGSGTRLGLGPKALLELGGRTVICRAVDAMAQCVGRVVVGAPAAHLDKARDGVPNHVKIVAGGSTRLETSRILFELTDEPVVIIFDVALPFLDLDLVDRVVDATRHNGGAATHAPTPFPAAQIENGCYTRVLPKSSTGLVRSPIGFQRPELEGMLQYAQRNGIEDLSHLELALRAGVKVAAVPCEDWHIKLTTPRDWQLAQSVLAPWFDNEHVSHRGAGTSRSDCPDPVEMSR